MVIEKNKELIEHLDNIAQMNDPHTKEILDVINKLITGFLRI